MMMVGVHIVFFVYLCAFFSAVSAITVLSIQHRNHQISDLAKYKHLLELFFFYEMMNFISFYKEYFSTSLKFSLFVFIVFTLTLIALLSYWAKTISDICPDNIMPPIYNDRFSYGLGMLYLVIWTILQGFFIADDCSFKYPFGKYLAMATIIIYYSYFCVPAFVILKKMHSCKSFFNEKWPTIRILALGIILFTSLDCLYYLNFLFPPYFAFLDAFFSKYPFDTNTFIFMLLGIYLAIKYHNYSPNPASAVPPDADAGIHIFSEKYQLTPRETETLALVFSGFNNTEIAEKLFISVNTVKRHMNSIFRKAEVTTRVELIHRIISEK